MYYTQNNRNKLNPQGEFICWKSIKTLEIELSPFFIRPVEQIVYLGFPYFPHLEIMKSAFAFYQSPKLNSQGKKRNSFLFL